MKNIEGLNNGALKYKNGYLAFDSCLGQCRLHPIFITNTPLITNTLLK